ncbi:hypothetical protein QVD17_25829 [Tagetes erecta]|uniref:DUF4283 domain-containing protein n=1 Tax=Tagetes erecta TaxID=13708 RepID=A0AAD8K6D0_TARER|nr:hypothetical protein QVD17_25829 [Tagetes erecta]
MEDKLNGTLVGGVYTSVNLARYDRWGNKLTEPGECPEPIRPPPATIPISANQMKHTKPGTSFKDVLQGPKSQPAIEPAHIKINLQESQASLAWKGLSLIGTAWDVSSLCNVKNLCFNPKIRAMTGLSVMLTFNCSEEAREFLLNNNNWIHWFAIVTPWIGQLLPVERMAWIRIHGVPIHLWDQSVFNQIGGSLGRVVQGSQITKDDEVLSSDLIGIIVSHVNRINTSLYMHWRNLVLQVWVEEETGDWLPDYLLPSIHLQQKTETHQESTSDSTSKLQDGDGVDDDLSENGSPAAGEKQQHINNNTVRVDSGKTKSLNDLETTQSPTKNEGTSNDEEVNLDGFSKEPCISNTVQKTFLEIFGPTCLETVNMEKTTNETPNQQQNELSPCDHNPQFSPPCDPFTFTYIPPTTSNLKRKHSKLRIRSPLPLSPSNPQSKSPSRKRFKKWKPPVNPSTTNDLPYQSSGETIQNPPINYHSLTTQPQTTPIVTEHNPNTCLSQQPENSNPPSPAFTDKSQTPLYNSPPNRLLAEADATIRIGEFFGIDLSEHKDEVCALIMNEENQIVN